jgi:peroxiredoxin
MSTKILGVPVVSAILAFSAIRAVAAEADVKSAASPAPSQAQAAAPLPGHSLHGEAFDEGPRQKAYLMPGTGGVHFPVTTSVPLAQQFFDQGVGQLHGFWYFEAERSFRQVAALDGDCAMAYWGMAMANANNDKRAKRLIEKAVQKKAAASPRERAWIDALSASYAGSDNTERRRKYVRDLEAIVQDNPNDVEARAFLALQIWKNGSWMTEAKRQLPISSHQAVDALLDQVFQAEPMHPAHHYRIHLWDDEKPARALVSASLNGQTSPGIAHMWHMPGHTYSKLHRYADAAWQQEASARVDHAHMMRDGVLPDQIHNYAHNNEWLIRNLAFLGRVHDAVDLATNMIELPRHPKYNTLEKSGTSAGLGSARLIDVLVQYERWNDLVAYSKTSYFQPTKNGPEDQLKRSRVLGLASFGQGNLDEGRKQIVALEELLKEKRSARFKAADDAEAKARGEKKSEQDIAKDMASAMASHGSSITNIERVLAELRGYSALAANNPTGARAEFEKVKDVDRIRMDHLARAFLQSGDNVQAESLARKAVENGPGEVYPLAVLVEVLYQTGKKQEAQSQFARLRALAARADLDSPVFERLKPMAQELNLAVDWRGPRDDPGDTGVRPELSSLGPFRWQPTPATSWTTIAADGKPLGLDQFRGKPVVVIFYLGSGCLHCVEQLHKFAPLAGEYASAGISLVAISSEPVDSLKGSLLKLSATEAISFPLSADPQLEVFKAYRAYDDFENMPLHATYLIDGEGLVRWHDISYEPFLDARFLLDEAKRLLGRQ